MFLFNHIFFDVIKIVYRNNFVTANRLCKQEAKNRGFDSLELDVWEFNEGAMKFYDFVGFKTYREYKEMNI